MKSTTRLAWRRAVCSVVAVAMLAEPIAASAALLQLVRSPLFVTPPIPPLVMLDISKDQQLYKKAYNEAVEFADEAKDYARNIKHTVTRNLTNARNEGVAMLFIHALSENTTMLNISRKAGATVRRDGAESQAYLLLPTADLESRISEIFDEQVAQTDYRFKVQARRFWDFLGTLQDVRQGVRDARK